MFKRARSRISKLHGNLRHISSSDEFDLEEYCKIVKNKWNLDPLRPN